MLDDLKCLRIDYATAAEFYEKYEHLGCPGRGVYHWGAYSTRKLVGAVSFGSACFGMHRGVFADVAFRHGIRVYQLTRGGTAPFAPKYCGSWLVSKGLKQLRILKGDTLVVAYSDPNWNEIGTIYQAANFAYLGKSDPKNQSDYIVRGQSMSGWKVRKVFGTRCMKELRRIDRDVVKIPLEPKYRYVYPATGPRLRRRILAELEHLLAPFPKRETEGIDSMSSVHFVEVRRNPVLARF